MYNGIGLQSVRGTGTSGHVQRNVARLRGSAVRGPRPRELRKSLHATLRGQLGERLGAAPAFAAHETRRKVEVAVAELEEDLEARGYEKDTIEEMKSKLREDLLARDEKEKEGQKDREIGGGRLRREEGKTVAAIANTELRERRNDRIKDALGVGADYQEGDFLQRMRTDKDKQKEAEAETERAKDPDIPKKLSTPLSGVGEVNKKDGPAPSSDSAGKLLDHADGNPQKWPGEVPANELSGSESSVLTPQSPSSVSSLPRAHSRDEENDAEIRLSSPQRTVSPSRQTRQRGSDVLLEESLSNTEVLRRDTDLSKRLPSDVGRDPVEDRRRDTNPRMDIYRDGPTREKSYFDKRKRNVESRTLKRDRERTPLSDSSRSPVRRRRHPRRYAREHSDSPSRYRKSFARRRRHTRNRRTRYSNEDDSYDSYDTDSSDSRSPSPRRRRRSPSSPRRYRSRSRSISPPRKRHRDEYKDFYDRRTPRRSRWDERARDNYRPHSPVRRRSPPRYRSISPSPRYQRSASPKHTPSRDDFMGNDRISDPYDPNTDRNSDSYHRNNNRRDRYRSPSRYGRNRYHSLSPNRYQSPSPNRYRSPSIDRARRGKEPEREDHYRESLDGPRVELESEPRLRYRSMRRGNPMRRSMSP